MKKMMMNGKTNKTTFQDLYNAQLDNQKELVIKGCYNYHSTMCEPSECLKLPQDDVGLFSYHIQQLISELGELLASDTRWKNFRNNKNNQANKLEELADCFIVLMNIAMFSGFSGEDLEKAIKIKENIVSERIDILAFEK